MQTGHQVTAMNAGLSQLEKEDPQQYLERARRNMLRLYVCTKRQPRSRPRRPQFVRGKEEPRLDTVPEMTEPPDDTSSCTEAQESKQHVPAPCLPKRLLSTIHSTLACAHLPTRRRPKPFAQIRRCRFGTARLDAYFTQTYVHDSCGNRKLSGYLDWCDLGHAISVSKTVDRNQRAHLPWRAVYDPLREPLSKEDRIFVCLVELCRCWGGLIDVLRDEDRGRMEAYWRRFGEKPEVLRWHFWWKRPVIERMEITREVVERYGW